MFLYVSQPLLTFFLVSILSVSSPQWFFIITDFLNFQIIKRVESGVHAVEGARGVVLGGSGGFRGSANLQSDFGDSTPFNNQAHTLLDKFCGGNPLLNYSVLIKDVVSQGSSIALLLTFKDSIPVLNMLTVQSQAS